MKEIYTNSYVSQWHVSQLGLPTTSVLAGPKLAVFHVPFPYDTQDAEFEILVDQALETADKIIILCSELHDRTVDFVRRYQQHKIKFFLCGSINGVTSFDWMDWVITTLCFYKENKEKVLDRLTPYSSKPKIFDILLGQPREHRTLIYNYINSHNLTDQVIMTYISPENKITPAMNNPGWIWEDQGLEVIDTDFKWTVGQVRYYGQQMFLSQVAPIKIYNQTAFSLVTETNFSNNFVFHTEKIVKPIIARRLFIAFAGQHYLRNLHRLGFKTFSDIIDERYDNEPDYRLRGQMICEQISHLIKQDQQQILDAVKPIVDHNYAVMMNTDWYGDFSKEFRAVLLAHTN
jgi:hypothetical protein